MNRTQQVKRKYSFHTYRASDVLPTLVVSIFFCCLFVYTIIAAFIMIRIHRLISTSSHDAHLEHHPLIPVIPANNPIILPTEVHMKMKQEPLQFTPETSTETPVLKPEAKELFGIPLTNNYLSWMNITLHLTSLSPKELVHTLRSSDPFQVRSFDQTLIQREMELGRILEMQEFKDLFTCPPDGQYFTRPSVASFEPHTFHSSSPYAFHAPNQTKARLFRENIHPSSSSDHGNNGYFLFFQHLRKAGGTNFCKLAQANIPTSSVPHYYCMPDWDWSHQQTAGYLHSYTNEQLIQFQYQGQWKIAGNEWETFRLTPSQDSHFHLPAVFATSFRRPLHRALSQFRFECIEERGCHIRNVTQWWENERSLQNIYLQTFADITKLYGFHRTCADMSSPEEVHKRQEYMQRAVNTVLQFHLVLIMEWLAYAPPLIESVLGFQDTAATVERVRPHFSQAKREEGKDHIVLGAADVTADGASWEPEKYLDTILYERMSEDLALDELLNDIARRVFLERVLCVSSSEE